MVSPEEAARLALSANRSDRARVFPVLDAEPAYFDHAAISPLPAPTAAVIHAHADEMSRSGSAGWPDWQRRIARVREAAGRLLSVPPRNVAFVPNTTAGINAVARGFRWREGDSLVLFPGDFPSNVFPWLPLERRGVELRRIGRRPGEVPTVESILAATDGSTRAIALCLVAYDDGVRFPVEALAEKAFPRGIHLFVDAIQGLGALPFDASLPGVDAVVADGHKWLLGTESAGIFVLSDRLLDRLEVTEPGWTNIAHPKGRFQSERLEFVDGAVRFEAGTPNTFGQLALGASLELLLAVGLENVRRRLDEITGLLRDRLPSAGFEVVSPGGEARSGIVSFRPSDGGDPWPISRRLAAGGVRMSLRQGLLRAAPHFYQDGSEVDRLLDALSG